MVIPGYDEAIAVERKRREEPYLSSVIRICGIPIKQVTPRLLSVLTNIETPYLGIGEVTSEHTLHFLWAMAVENPMRREKATWFRKTAQQKFIIRNQSIDFDKAEAEIWEFLEATFMDAPRGKAAVPYASSIAWMEYSMSSKPFCWDYDTKTADIPIRRIYQLIRCRALDAKAVLDNQISDKVKAEWLAEIREKTKTMNPTELCEFYTRINAGGRN